MQWGCNIVMIALSILINRPITYINCYDQKQNPNSIQFWPNEIEILSSTESNEHSPRFRIAYAFNCQLSRHAISLMLYNDHFVSLAATNSNKSVFDFSSTEFFNEFSELLQDEYFN